MGKNYEKALASKYFLLYLVQFHPSILPQVLALSQSNSHSAFTYLYNYLPLTFCQMERAYRLVPVIELVSSCVL